MKKQPNNIYVLWSGGLDSTFLIQHLLTIYPNANVFSGYVEIMNNPSKTRMEKQAIERLIPLLNSKYNNRLKHIGTTLKCEISKVSEWIPLKQLPIWITSIISTTPYDIDEIALGYVLNDCAISYIHDIKHVISSWRKGFSPKFPNITFPLVKFNKEQIMNEIHFELINEVVWCEMPTENNGLFIPCNSCVPCKRSPLSISKLNDISYQLNAIPVQLNFIDILMPDFGAIKCVG